MDPKKKLVEQEPEDLSFEMLCILHGGLMSKLLLVNRELQKRCRVFVDNPVEGAEGPLQVLSAAIIRLESMNVMLEEELSRKGWMNEPIFKM